MTAVFLRNSIITHKCDITVDCILNIRKMIIMDNNEDIEIDLFRLCRFILSKWKIILFSCVLFAMLGFTYKYLSFKYSSVPLAELDKQFEVKREEKLPDGRIQTVTKKVNYNIYKADYDAKVSEYKSQMDNYVKNKKIISEKIKLAQLALDRQNDYLSKSHLFNADESSYYEAVFFYTVKELENSAIQLNQSDNNINSGVVYAQGLAGSGEFARNIASKLGLNADSGFKSAQELVTVAVKNKETFELTVKADSKDLMGALVKEIDVFNEKLALYCKDKYDLRVEQLSSGNGSVENLNNLKKNETQFFERLQNDLNNLNIQQASLLEPIKFDDYGKLADLEKFKLFKYIKLTLIGFVFGLFLPIGIYVLKYLLDGRLKDENYVTNAFRINKIACIHSRDGIKSDARAVETLDSNLSYVISKGHKSVVFVSTLCGIKEQKLTEIASLIDKYNNQNGVSVKLVAPGAILEIDSADTVIIAERLDVSDFNAVVDEVKNVLAVKEKIYGIVYA